MEELNAADGCEGNSSSIYAPPPPKRSKSSSEHTRSMGSGLSRDITQSFTDHQEAQQSQEHSQYSRNTNQSSTPQLTMADHHRVSNFLRDLDNDQLIGVGVALGLYRPSLKRMKDLLGDMVSAWFREDDNVTVASGSPSWASLSTALEDIGHKGIASKIRNGPMQAIQTATPPSPEMSSAFSRYRNYLKSYYNTNPVARDDKLSIAPCSEFISLALVKKDKSVHNDDAFSQSTRYGGRDQITAHKVPLELDAILTSESKFILVEGPPGIGKSTLSWELCRKWDTLTSLRHYSIVLLLKLRERRVQNASSLNELFYHRDRALCESVVSEVLRCEGEGVLLILDGFDEMPASVVRNEENNLIMEIIGGTCIPRATRLVTSRPSALCHESYFPQEFRHVEIVGFTDENIEKFAEIAFKSEPDVLAEFKKFIFLNPVIKSFMYIPVNCAILAQSYKDITRSSNQVPKTTTQLYSMLTRILIRRHLIAIGTWDKYSKVPSDLKDLPEDVKGDLERVSKLAYTGLFKEDVQLVFADSDVGEGFHPLGLLSEVKEMYVCEGARTSYSFLHLSLQEFLAAWHILCNQELVIKALAKILQEVNPHIHVFGRILAGLIGTSDLYLKHLEYNNHMSRADITLYTCHCLYEAQVRNMFSDIFEKECFNAHPLILSSPLDLYVFGYCLVCVPHKWWLFITSSIDMLVSSLADHASGCNVLGSIGTLELWASESSSSRLKDLPCSLLNSIEELMIHTDQALPLLEGMPWFPLKKITIGNIDTHPKVAFESDYLLQNLSKCFNLKSLKVGAKLTERGIVGLTNTVAKSSTIEEIELKIFYRNLFTLSWLDPPATPALSCLSLLTKAALSCPSLKSLTTDFIFIVSNHHMRGPKNLSRIRINSEIFTITDSPRLFDFLYNITTACAMTSLESLWLRVNGFFVRDDEGLFTQIPLFFLPYDCVGDYYDCISLLNVCLHHHWPSMKRCNLPFYIPCTQFHLNSLSRALRRDPDTSQLKLRRSKSMSDLACLKTLDEHASNYFTSSNFDYCDKLVSVNIKKIWSCPDLAGIQSLHPLIAEELFQDTLPEHWNRQRKEGFPIPNSLSQCLPSLFPLNPSLFPNSALSRYLCSY